MTSGPLMVIGGAEDKTGHRQVLARFIKLAGGAGSRVAVIATASSLGDEILDAYRAVLLALGAGEVVTPRPRTRAEAADPAVVEQLSDVSGIFMTGGNQSTLSGVVTGTPFGAAILDAHSRGVVIGGTSAGASVQSQHMIAFGREGTTPKLRMAQMSAGLGLLPGVVIDQHFDERGRYGRLLSLVAHSPHLIGMGVDEDTAAVITEGHLVEVVGRGAVTLFDGGAMTSNVDTAAGTSPLLVSGVLLHSLPAGSRFDLASRSLLAGAGGRPDDLRDRPPRTRKTGRLEQLIAVEGAKGDLPVRRSAKKEEALP